MSNENTPQVPEPSEGGRYLRNADGSLTRLDQTEPGRRRSKPEPADAAPAPAMTPAPEGAAITGDGSGTALPLASPHNLED